VLNGATEPALTPPLDRADRSELGRLLVVVDGPGSASLAGVLERSGYEVRVEHDRRAAPAAVRAWWPDFVILDLRFHILDGVLTCRRIRTSSTVPILILVRNGSVAARIRAFEAGADTCLTEPFSFEELLGRLRAGLRRTPFSAHDERLEVCDLVLDVGRHEVSRGGRPIELTAREFEILELLVRHRGHVLTRSQIRSALWDSAGPSTSNVLAVHVHALRQKLDADFEPKLIQTVHGIGYRIRSPEAGVVASPTDGLLGTPAPAASPTQPAAPRHTETDMTTPRVLIVEDDHELRGVLVRGLQEEGFEAEAVGSGAEFLGRAGRSVPDALVVDIGLPDADGRDLCHTLRAEGQQVPVLFLTARDALPDRLSGFRSGGDDYMTKPFAFEELVARLQALLRRSWADGPLEASGLVLDPVSHAASVEQASVNLTPTEFRLLACLLAAPFAVIRRRDLIRAAWPEGAIVHQNTLDAYIMRVRRKLRSLPGAPSIATMRSVGYRIE
jgi:DNA-binding response OmpR family regulator